MMPHIVCPSRIVNDVLDACARVLEKAAPSLQVRHLAIGFVDNRSLWRFPEKLKIDCRTIETSAGEGLVGYALKTGRDWLWPDDKETPAVHFDVSSDVAKEAVAPIIYNGRVTGALLVDIKDNEPLPSDLEKWRRDIAELAGKISSILNSHEDAEQNLRAALNGIIDRCVSDTASTRGYIAVKRWDGPLEYFWEKDEKSGRKNFLNLNPNQGLCGYVLQTGNILNEANVFANPLYISSDENIKSELIIPIKDGAGETVGVLNLERTVAGEFEGGLLDDAKAAAAEAVRSAVAFRNLTREGDPLGEVAQEAFNYNGREDIETFADFLAKKLAKALVAQRPLVWVHTHDAPPELANVLKNYKGGAGCLPHGKAHVLYGPIGMPGECIVGVVIDESPSAQIRTSFEQVCRIATQAMELRRQDDVTQKFELLIRNLVASPTSHLLYEAVITMKDVTMSDHCTLYARSRVNGVDFLACVASTSMTILETAKRERLYHIRAQPYDGLTGFVGTTGTPVEESNLSDLTQDHWNQIEPGFSWVTGMAEDEEGKDIAAFVCRPICRPSDGKVIAVFRLFRKKTVGQRGDYDKITKQRIAFFCELAGAVFGEREITTSAYEFGVNNMGAL